MDSPVWSEPRSDTSQPTTPRPQSAASPRLATSDNIIRRNSVEKRRISFEDNSVRRTSRDYRRNSDDFRRISIGDNDNRGSKRNSIESIGRSSDERLRRTPAIQNPWWTSPPPTSIFGYQNNRAAISFGLLEVASNILKV